MTHDITYIWNLIYDINEPMRNRNRFTDTENRPRQTYTAIPQKNDWGRDGMGSWG